MDRRRLSSGPVSGWGDRPKDWAPEADPLLPRLRSKRLTEQNWEGVLLQEKHHPERCDALPESLHLELTKACNFRCAHCGTHGSQEVHTRSNAIPCMDPALLDRMADQILPSVRRVSLVGEGEPFLAPRSTLVSLFKHLERTGTLLEASTNGALIDSALIEGMLPVLGHLTFSLDAASPQMFQKIRRSGAFEKILQTVRTLIRLRDRGPRDHPFQISISFALMRENGKELIDFLRLAKDLQVDAVYVRHLLVHFSDFRSQTLIDKPDEANPLIERAYREAERLGISAFLPDLIACQGSSQVPADSAPASGTQTAHCSFLWRTLVIAANGEVLPCGGLCSPVLGTLQRDGLKEIWNGDTIREMRRRLNTSDPYPACAHCWYREVSYFDSPAITEEFAQSGPRKPPRTLKEKPYDAAAFISRGA